ncbi:hypothetical protein CASFOL_008083 [Castilleja foliolosa]|uniref:Reticulon-like protein n=1 Tax=Castilleja foliolosa TaxID=1961234 RepID=A0ABD3DXY9_9LAMI
MDTTPPPPSLSSELRTKPKSTSRLSKLRHYSRSPIPQLSLEIVPSSPKISPPSPEPSAVSPKPPYTLPLKEILMLSPSPIKRPKARLPEMADDAAFEHCGVRKRCKNRNSIASPRSNRRSRRKLEQDAIVRDDREFLGGDDILIKPRKKRQSERSRKSKSKIPSPVNDDGFNLDAIGENINDLIMWKDVSKSSLWFGFGSLCFLSSCFTRGVHFSIFSFLSRVGLLFLGLSFFSNSMRKRNTIYRDATEETKREFKLTDDDILRVGRLILPAANLAISKMRRVFSGEPAMTLKVVPILLVGAEYGHLITLWRLCALGFFISFTGPKLYSTHSSQISKKIEYLKTWALDAWGGCTHKKIVASSAVTAFWSLTSIRTRIFAAFLCLVILRYRREQTEVVTGGEEHKEEGKQEQQQEKEKEKEKAIIPIEIESKK